MISGARRKVKTRVFCHVKLTQLLCYKLPYYFSMIIFLTRHMLFCYDSIYICIHFILFNIESNEITQVLASVTKITLIMSDLNPES